MSLEQLSIEEDGEFNEDGLQRKDSTRTVEIFIENDNNILPKVKTKKKHKNEHRKSKKRKHESSDESDENLSNIKMKHDSEKRHKKLKKSKKKKKKEQKYRNESEQEEDVADEQVYIKQEVISENEQNSDGSDEDVPLSFLEKDSSKENTRSLKKTFKISKKGTAGHPTIKIKKVYMKKKKFKDDFETACKECDKTFDTNLKYKAHMRKVHGDKPYTCIVCSKAFSKEKDLLNHHNTHTGHNPYCCGQCGKLFKSDSSLKKHVRIYHAENIKKYSCSMCSKVLSSASCLEEHERLHTGENPWSCNLCGKLFARERDLKLHTNLHEELFKCDVCQKCFITSFKLKEHYRSHTGETPYECDKCDRKFARLSDYRYHLGTHLGLKPFSCVLCDMKFTTSSSMKRHLINMHQQGPLDFKCNLCPKAFVTQTRLNSHIKNHENKKRYTCHICNATRSSHSELQRHLILHSGEFRCDTCNINCSSAERLATHLAKHDLTGKPYACFVCSLGYTTSQTLNKHLATVHKNEDVPKVAPQHLCTLCGMVYDLKDKLNRHLKDDHVVLAVGEIHSLLDDQIYDSKARRSQIAKLRELQEKEKIETAHDPVSPKHIDDSHTKQDIRGSDEESDNNSEKLINIPEEISGAKTNLKSPHINDPENKNAESSAVSGASKLSQLLMGLKDPSYGLKGTVDTKIPTIKIEKDDSANSHYSTSHRSETISNIPDKNDHNNPVEVIQTLARRNIESYLNNQSSCNVTSFKSPEHSIVDKSDDDSFAQKPEEISPIKDADDLPTSDKNETNIKIASLKKSDIIQDVGCKNNLLANLLQSTSYYDGLPPSLSDNKYKTQSKPDVSDDLYSKTAYSMTSPTNLQYPKLTGQTFKNIYDRFENYNHTQSNIQSNPWFVPEKTTSRNEHQVAQGDNKLKVRDHRQDILNAPPHASQQKHLYGSDPLNYKNYFDELSQRQHRKDDKKRSYLHPNANDIESTKQAALTYPTLETLKDNNLPSSSYINSSDPLNYYNPHAFAALASTSPHLFQNFRELQQRMLSSGIPGYNSHHPKQHPLSAVSGETQNNPTGSSIYDQMNVQSRMSHNPVDSNNSLSYHSERPSDSEDGQGKDDGSGPYELRVAANWVYCLYNLMQSYNLYY